MAQQSIATQAATARLNAERVLAGIQGNRRSLERELFGDRDVAKDTTAAPIMSSGSIAADVSATIYALEQAHAELESLSAFIVTEVAAQPGGPELKRVDYRERSAGQVTAPPMATVGR